jgi:methyl-accepting chemotaxis protein
MPGIVSWLLLIAAVLSLIAFGLLVVVALEIRDLVRQIKNELMPVIGSAQQTVKTVQGTSEFVSSGLVKPLIASVSASAGVAKTVQVLSSSVVRSFRRAPKPAALEENTIHGEVTRGQRK